MTTLYIKSFQLFHNLSVSIDEGLTVITGHSGSGKSLLMQALSYLACQPVKSAQHQTCDLSLTLQPSLWQSIIQKLDAKLIDKLTPLSGIQPPILRRWSDAAGKSKQSINGIQVSQKGFQLALDSYLFLHHQHVHLHFFQSDSLLNYINLFVNKDCITEVKHAYQHVQTCKRAYQEVNQQLAKLPEPSWLNQVMQEVRDAELLEVDVVALDRELKRLQHQQDMVVACYQSSEQLTHSEEGVVSKLSTIQKALQSQSQHFSEIQAIEEVILDAQALLSDAAYQLSSLVGSQQDHGDHGQKLEHLEKQLAKVYELSRKYKIQPNEFHDFIRNIDDQLHLHEELKNQLATCQDELVQAEKNYVDMANKIHQERVNQCQNLNQLLPKWLSKVGLEQANCELTCVKNQSTWRDSGFSEAACMFNANKGTTPLPILKNASGGEMTRVWFIMQLLVPQPTRQFMLFDEADVGLSGAQSSQIGEMLKQLSMSHTVWCITHSAQVATYGDQHWLVSKSHQSQETASSLESLNDQDRLKELARLLGGKTIDSTTIAHAQSLLNQAQVPLTLA